MGTTVDVTKGRVTLVAAANKAGGTMQGGFYDGTFKFTQTKGAKPLTTLRLTDKLSCGSGKASAAAKKKKRRLWGDGKGRFRTSGSFSSATVRGTKWLVEDTCTTTTTRVTRGSVTVRDFVRQQERRRQGRQEVRRPAALKGNGAGVRCARRCGQGSAVVQVRQPPVRLTPRAPAELPRRGTTLMNCEIPLYTVSFEPIEGVSAR